MKHLWPWQQKSRKWPWSTDLPRNRDNLHIYVNMCTKFKVYGIKCILVKGETSYWQILRRTAKCKAIYCLLPRGVMTEHFVRLTFVTILYPVMKSGGGGAWQNILGDWPSLPSSTLFSSSASSSSTSTSTVWNRATLCSNVNIHDYCKRAKFRVGVISVFFALLSSLRKLPPSKN